MVSLVRAKPSCLSEKKLRAGPEAGAGEHAEGGVDPATRERRGRLRSSREDVVEGVNDVGHVDRVVVIGVVCRRTGGRDKGKDNRGRG